MTDILSGVIAVIRNACRTVGTLLLVTPLVACTAATQAPDAGTAACVVVADEPRALLTIGVAGAGADASDARARAERLLSAQVFQTLVRMDCTGAVVGVLAETWSSADGRTWRFRVAPGATFHDGVPVTARTIAEAWSAASVPAFASVSAVADMELAVTLVAAADVRVFADASHAVRRRAADGFTGTGAFRFDGDTAGLRIVAMSEGEGPQSISARLFAGDPRNALDSGVDALVTGNPAVLAYARARSDYTAVPLPWSRTYVIASTAQDTGSRPSPAVLDALATEAARGEARAAEGPFWWEQCTDIFTPSDSPYGERERVIIYPEGDMIARGLAERIAALAWPRERTPAWLRDLLPTDDASGAAPVARGVDDGDFAAAIRARTPLAVIAPLPRVSLGGCTRLAAVPRDGTGSLEDVMLAAASTWTLTPLLDARDYLVYRRGLGRVTVDGTGTIRFANDP